MLVRPGMLIIAGMALVAVGVLFLLQNGNQTSPRESVSIVSTKDGKSNPGYEDYQFGRPDDPIVDAGFQPLAFPAGTVPTIMMHDQWLHKQLADRGIKLKFHPFLDGNDANGFLFSGKLEMLWAGDMPTINAAARSAIVVTAQIKNAFTSVVARNLNTMEQLKGHRIGYAHGSTGHQVLLHGLKLYHVDEKEVQLVRVPINRLIGALQKGSIDAFVAWEPAPTMAMGIIKDLTVLYRAMTQSYLYFTKIFADAHPDLVKVLTAANLRAVRWLSQRQENMRQGCRWQAILVDDFVKEPYPVTVSQCVTIVQRDLLDPLPMTLISMDNLKPGGIIEQQVQFLQHVGALKTDNDPSRIPAAFNPAILQEIIRDQVDWKIHEFDYQ